MQAEYLRRRNALVQVVEELKITRVTNIENEKRIDRLVKEKHEIESNCDSEVSKMCSTIQSLEEKLRQTKNAHDNQIKLMKQQQTLQETMTKMEKKEMQSLKETVRQLQAQKYSMDKQLSETRNKLQLHVSNSDGFLAQLSALEKNVSSLQVMAHDVTSHCQRLDQAVKKATSNNRTLRFTNCHQKCLLEAERARVSRLQDDIIATKTAYQTAAAEDKHHVDDMTRQVSQLQSQLSEKESLLHSLREKMVELKESHEKATSVITDSSLVLSKHVTAIEQRDRDISFLTEQRMKLDTEICQLQAQRTAQCSELDELVKSRDELKHVIQQKELLLTTKQNEIENLQKENLQYIKAKELLQKELDLLMGAASFNHDDKETQTKLPDSKENQTFIVERMDAQSQYDVGGHDMDTQTHEVIEDRENMAQAGDAVALVDPKTKICIEESVSKTVEKTTDNIDSVFDGKLPAVIEFPRNGIAEIPKVSEGTDDSAELSRIVIGNNIGDVVRRHPVCSYSAGEQKGIEVRKTEAMEEFVKIEVRDGREMEIDGQIDDIRLANIPGSSMALDGSKGLKDTQILPTNSHTEIQANYDPKAGISDHFSTGISVETTASQKKESNIDVEISEKDSEIMDTTKTDVQIIRNIKGKSETCLHYKSSSTSPKTRGEILQKVVSDEDLFDPPISAESGNIPADDKGELVEGIKYYTGAANNVNNNLSKDIGSEVDRPVVNTGSIAPLKTEECSRKSVDADEVAEGDGSCVKDDVIKQIRENKEKEIDINTDKLNKNRLVDNDTITESDVSKNTACNGSEEAIDKKRAHGRLDISMCGETDEENVNSNELNTENDISGNITKVIDNKNGISENEKNAFQEDTIITINERKASENVNKTNENGNEINEHKNGNKDKDNGNDISENRNDIIENRNDISENRNGIIEDGNDIIENRNDICDNRNDIGENKNNISENMNNISKNQNNFRDNKNNCSENRNDIIKNKNDISENIKESNETKGELIGREEFDLERSDPTVPTLKDRSNIDFLNKIESNISSKFTDKTIKRKNTENVHCSAVEKVTHCERFGNNDEFGRKKQKLLSPFSQYTRRLKAFNEDVGTNKDEASGDVSRRFNELLGSEVEVGRKFMKELHFERGYSGALCTSNESPVSVCAVTPQARNEASKRSPFETFELIQADWKAHTIPRHAGTTVSAQPPPSLPSVKPSHDFPALRVQSSHVSHATEELFSDDENEFRLSSQVSHMLGIDKKNV